MKSLLSAPVRANADASIKIIDQLRNIVPAAEGVSVANENEEANGRDSTNAQLIQKLRRIVGAAEGSAFNNDELLEQVRQIIDGAALAVDIKFEKRAEDFVAHKRSARDACKVYLKGFVDTLRNPAVVGSCCILFVWFYWQEISSTVEVALETLCDILCVIWGLFLMIVVAVVVKAIYYCCCQDSSSEFPEPSSSYSYQYPATAQRIGLSYPGSASLIRLRQSPLSSPGNRLSANSRTTAVSNRTRPTTATTSTTPSRHYPESFGFSAPASNAYSEEHRAGSTADTFCSPPHRTPISRSTQSPAPVAATSASSCGDVFNSVAGSAPYGYFKKHRIVSAEDGHRVWLNVNNRQLVYENKADAATAAATARSYPDLVNGHHHHATFGL